MNEYLFDVKLFASFRVAAEDETAARRMLDEALQCADANFGAWPNGDPIEAEVSADDGEHELMEINGEAV